MKKIIIYLLLTIPSLAKCQMAVNIISDTEFYNIKINTTTLDDIELTKGSPSQVRSLFSYTVKESTQQPVEDYYDYSYDGFTIGFSEGKISAFQITNTKWSIIIQGNEVTIGDDISLLGNVVFNENLDGSKSIVYQFCNGCNNFIYIDFNQSTKRITKIGFVELT